MDLLKRKGIKQCKCSKCKTSYGCMDTPYCPIKDDKTAKEWLNTEEYDFRERELMNKTQAVNFVGRQSVNNAIEV